MKAVCLEILHCLEGESGRSNTVQNIVRRNLNTQVLRDRSQRIVNTDPIWISRSRVWFEAAHVFMNA
jgi:hypothetical protein